MYGGVVMLNVRPGGHPMKPLKFDMAPHLPKGSVGKLGLGKGLEGAL